MKTAIDLSETIEAIKGKLQAEGIDIYDHNKAVKCLSRCVAPEYCIEIYENYMEAVK